MAVPKQRKTKSRRNQRRMHIYLDSPTLTVCPHCGKKMRPHTVCEHCGYYNGREVFNVLEKLEKKERKKREQEMKRRGREEKNREEKQKPLTLEELSKKKF